LKKELEAAEWTAGAPQHFEATAEHLIELASWIRLKEKGSSNLRLISRCNREIENAPMYNITRAQKILKSFPELIPEANEEEMIWPEETKRTWRQVFGTPPPSEQRLQRQIDDANTFRWFFGKDAISKTLLPSTPESKPDVCSCKKKDTGEKTS